MAKQSTRELLSPAEKKVIDLICQGQTVEQIVATLGITRVSVRLHMRHVRIKLGIGRSVSLYDYFGDGCKEKEVML
jgi:DNA-binding CsgD family transcriptional regulator